MELEAIRAEYERLQGVDEPQRTNELVKLMNVLEREYGTFKTWRNESQAPDLTTPEMVLYQQISAARE